jgi:hypothetical protein
MAGIWDGTAWMAMKSAGYSPEPWEGETSCNDARCVKGFITAPVGCVRASRIGIGGHNENSRRTRRFGRSDG